VQKCEDPCLILESPSNICQEAVFEGVRQAQLGSQSSKSQVTI